MKKTLTLLYAFMLVLGVVLNAAAIEFSGSASGVWSNVISTQYDDVYSVNNNDSGGTAEFNWGVAVSGSTENSFSFNGTGSDGSQTWSADSETGEIFSIGDFSYQNGRTSYSFGIEGVSLGVNLQITNPTFLAESHSFNFLITNTPNSTGNPVLDGDIVTTNTSMSNNVFTYENNTYKLELLGFSSDNGAIIRTNFSSPEDSSVSANLYARITSDITSQVPTLTPQISSIFEESKESLNSGSGVLKLYVENSETFTQDTHFFDSTKDTYVITHGWNGVGSSIFEGSSHAEEIGWISATVDELAKNNDANILVFDWTELANSTDFNPMSVMSLTNPVPELLLDYLSSGGDWWVPNAQVDNMANELSEQLSSLYSLGNNEAKLNFIGHSLGAAVSAKAMYSLMDESLSSNAFELNRLTLLDAPEDQWAALSGGKVNLDSTINHLNNSDVIIENIYSDASGPMGGYGKSYSGIDNTEVTFETHRNIQDWYLNTINPGDFTPDTIFSSYPYDWGFDRQDFELNDDIITFAGGTVNVLSPTGGIITFFEDSYLEVDQSATPNTVSYDEIINDINYFSHSPSGLGGMSETALGIEMYSGSPIYGYYEMYIPESAVGFYLDFMPELWDATDAFAVAIDDTLLYMLSGKYFKEDWMSTGVLDVSAWAGRDVVFTFGFLSDFTGHTLILGDQYLVHEQNQPVPEPSTILLLGGGLAGLAFYRRKRK